MSLAEYYSNNRDPSQRRKELGELAKALSFSDKYFIAQLVNLNARIDIFGRLPMEIGEKVLQYLPLYQCFQARRVSRRWNALLRVPHAIQERLAQETECEEVKWDGDLNGRAATVDAFRRAYPFSMRQFLMKEPTSCIECYAHGYIAYKTYNPDSREILVLNVITGSVQRIATPNREVVYCVDISPTMLITDTDSGKCYIWDLSENMAQTTPRCLQLERLDSMAAAVSRSSLALYTQHLDSQLKIITWDKDSGRTYQFSIPYSSKTSSIDSVQLASDGRSMLLLTEGEYSFDNATLSNYRTPYTLHRMSLCGRILSPGEEIAVDDFSDLKSSNRLVHCRSSTILKLFLQLQDQPWRLTLLYYNRHQDLLETKSMHVDACPVEDWHLVSCFVYETVLYLRYPTNADYLEYTLQVIDLQDGEVLFKSAINAPLQRRQWQETDEVDTEMGLSSFDGYTYFFADGRFIVYCAEPYLNILCFDSKADMIDADPTYRGLRHERFKTDTMKQREPFSHKI